MFIALAFFSIRKIFDYYAADGIDLVELCCVIDDQEESTSGN